LIEIRLPNIRLVLDDMTAIQRVVINPYTNTAMAPVRSTAPITVTLLPMDA
jgi:hypothetical protein